jgi:hypothetical protein
VKPAFIEPGTSRLSPNYTLFKLWLWRREDGQLGSTEKGFSAFPRFHVADDLARDRRAVVYQLERTLTHKFVSEEDQRNARLNGDDRIRLSSYSGIGPRPRNISASSADQVPAHCE